MPVDYFQPLVEDKMYHIFNRGNNGTTLFYKEDNYHYFLKKFDHYLSNYVEVYSYCLLPNHFHFLVKIKSFSDVPDGYKFLRKGTQTLLNPSDIISESFRKFFLSYAKSIKIQEARTGSLFEKNFKRIVVESDSYYTNLINYIHQNPVKHKISSSFHDYPYSSYSRILMNNESKLKKQEVLEWFGGKERFINHHINNPIQGIEHLIIE